MNVDNHLTAVSSYISLRWEDLAMDDGFPNAIAEISHLGLRSLFVLPSTTNGTFDESWNDSGLDRNFVKTPGIILQRASSVNGMDG